jgi:hypothetical protein
MKDSSTKRYYFLKLVPPRPTFAQDITEAEAKLMQQHVLYWKGLMEEGLVVIFGLVGDPAGPFGMGVVEVDDGIDIRPLSANDPTIKANAGFRYEVFPMPRALARG